ncbi:MAG: hypothetical protein HKN56_06095 [Gammaproteobacteria bacterium]|nr:hypothetical protein [Gammaproteobacteria bacterium]
MHQRIVELLTALGFAMAAICFYWYWQSSAVPVLLLALVTFGMSYDFLNHVLGARFPEADHFLQDYARLNFAALCFGIPFTAYAGTFVMAQVVPDGFSATLARYYLPVLHVSVIFGLLFLFARYKRVEIEGAVEYVLNKDHSYTRTIFILRRVLLAASLLIAIAVILDGWGSDYQYWSLLFFGVFVSSIPLHIMHKQIPSMFSELFTQGIAMYATWRIFVAGVPAG